MMNRVLSTAASSPAAWLLAGLLLGQPAVARAAPALAASATAQALTPTTLEELYPSAGLRDPFAPVAGVGGGKGVKDAPAAGPAMTSDDFSIHNLELKGIMEDRTGGFAILIDPRYGASFVLRRGKLFDQRNKPVPGVTGEVKAKQRIVQLVAGPEKDVQILTMNEREDEDYEGGTKDKQ